jgi:tetratricopeptide (TPR) repeat protein
VSSTPVDWIGPVAILAAGLILGLFFILRRGSRPADQLEEATALADVERKFDALIAQLRELGADEEHRRGALELEAAITLREVERIRAAELEEETEDEAETVPSMPPANPALKPAIWFAAGALSASVVFLLLWQFMTPRKEGGPVTGGAMQAGATGAAETDPRIAQLEQAVSADPENLELRNDLSRALVTQQRWMETWEHTEFVLARDAENPRALSYQALVRLAMGESQQAEQMLKKALEKDPNLLDGWIHLALVYFDGGRTQEAVAALRTAKERNPGDAEALTQLEQELMVAAASPREPVPSAPPAAPLPNASDSPSFRGEIAITGGSVKLPTLVFVTVRQAGAAGGPPVAAKRIAASSFPLQFEVSATDSMMGMPLPEEARIEARIDPDGDPLTRSPSDPSAVADRVKLGSTIRLQLPVR